MLKLDDIKKNATIAGIEPGQVMRALTTEPVGDIEVSAQKCGWDVTHLSKAVNVKQPPIRQIAIKGRAKDQNAVTVERNEIPCGLNRLGKFILTMTLVDASQHEGPFFVTKPFTQEPDWAVHRIDFAPQTLLERSALPC